MTCGDLFPPPAGQCAVTPTAHRPRHSHFPPRVAFGRVTLLFYLGESVRATGRSCAFLTPRSVPPAQDDGQSAAALGPGCPQGPRGPLQLLPSHFPSSQQEGQAGAFSFRAQPERCGDHFSQPLAATSPCSYSRWKPRSPHASPRRGGDAGEVDASAQQHRLGGGRR